MRDILALLLTLLTVAVILLVWRHRLAARRRDRHSIRFRLDSGSEDEEI